MPEDRTPHDPPRDIRHDWGYPTFREHERVENERDLRYEQRFKGIERLIGHVLTGFVVLSVLVAVLILIILAAVWSGKVH